MERVEAEVAVRNLINQAVQAWNANDLEGYTRCFLPTVVHVTLEGVFLQGREAFQRRFHEAAPSGTVAFKTVHISHPVPTVAVAVVEATMAVADRPHKSFFWIGTITMVQMAQGEWQIAAMHNSQVEPEARGWFAHAWQWISGRPSSTGDPQA